MRILVVEDSKSLNDIILDTLKSHGFEADTAENGVEAWKMLQYGNNDLIITDWVMPEMDGLELCRKIRSQYEKNKKYRYVIVLTSKKEKEDIVEVFGSGADDYISKPFDAEELIARVNTAKRILELESRHKKINLSLKSKSYELARHVKELNCLHSISKLIHKPGISVDELLGRAVDIILQSLREPENSCVRIISGAKEYRSDNFQETPFNIIQDIKSTERSFGSLEICLINGDIGDDISHFDTGDKRLINGVAVKLGLLIEKKVFERNLEESEKRYRNILANIEEGYFELDLSGRLVFANESMSRIFGYPLDKLLELEGSKLMDEDNYNKAASALKKVYENEKPLLLYGYEILTRDKGKKYAEVSLSILKNSEGEKIGFRGILRDVTSRKEYEDNLKLFRELINQSKDAIFILNESASKINYVNSRAAEIFCSSFLDMIGLSLESLVKELNSEKVKSLVSESHSGGMDACEIAINCKINEKIDVEVGANVIDYAGNPHYLVIMRDITARKQVEKEKEGFQSQLLQSEKMASIGQLSAGVAHEINNPTGFVSSNLSTLADYQNDIRDMVMAYKRYVSECEKIAKASGDNSACSLDDVLKFEKEIDLDFILNDSIDLIAESKEGTQRIKKIVEDLKNYAHPGDDNPVFTDLNENLESTLNVVWNELKYKADVKKDFGKIPKVKCLPQQLNQVFGNLLVNAAQAMDKQGEIRISTSYKDDFVVVKIEDNGSGIAPENIKKIYDPFFTTKPVGKGTGLGLNVVYNIIKKHNGDINVESEPGKGTVFTIRLPEEGFDNNIVSEV